MAFLAPEPPCWHSANHDLLLALGGSPWKWPVTYTRSRLHERAAAAPEQDDDREVSAVNRWPEQEKMIPPPISENEASEQAAAFQSSFKRLCVVKISAWQVSKSSVNPAGWKQWWDYIGFSTQPLIISLGNNLFCSLGTLRKFFCVQQQLCNRLKLSQELS